MARSGPDKQAFDPSRYGSRRTSKRHSPDASRVQCELGQVLDLSATGMRVACRWRPPIREGQTLAMTLSLGKKKLQLTVRAMWIRRQKLVMYQMGLQFLGVSKAMGRAIESYAQFGFFCPDAMGGSTQGGSTPSSQGPPRAHAAVALPDYYGVLEINARASPEQIRAAYRRLAREHHPDHCDAPDAAKRFAEIAEAYDILSDEERRASYDRMRRSSRHAA